MNKNNKMHLQNRYMDVAPTIYFPVANMILNKWYVIMLIFTHRRFHRRKLSNDQRLHLTWSCWFKAATAVATEKIPRMFDHYWRLAIIFNSFTFIDIIQIGWLGFSSRKFLVQWDGFEHIFPGMITIRMKSCTYQDSTAASTDVLHNCCDSFSLNQSSYIFIKFRTNSRN